MFRVVIDALCFQDNPDSPYSLFWENLLNSFDEDLSSEELCHYSVIVLVRGTSFALRCKKYRNILKLPIAFYDYRCALSDYDSLGSLCKSLSANLFISTGYSIAYGLQNIGFLNSFIDDTAHSFQSRKLFLLQSIYFKSLPCHLLFSNSLKKRFQSNCNIHQSRSLRVFRPPMLDTNIKARSAQIVVSAETAEDFPFILFSDSSLPIILDFLQCFLDYQPFNAGALPLGIVINSVGNQSSQVSQDLSARFMYGIHVISCKSQYLPVLFESAILSIFLENTPNFPFGIIYSMFYGCPVACAASPITAEVLSCVEKKDFLEYQANAPEKLFEYIQAIVNFPFRVSSQTMANLALKYPLSASIDLLTLFEKLATCIDSPLDYYLRTSLPVDGIMGSHDLIE